MRDAVYRDLRRRTLVFSILGLLLCVVLVAALESQGLIQNRGAVLELLMRVQASGRRFDRSHAPGLMAVGALAGMLAGMLGMGGGVLKVAGMLVVLQLDILLARAVSLVTMFLATASATYVHMRAGAVQRDVVRPMLLPATVGVLAGLVLGEVLPRVTLTHFFGFFALFLGLNTLAQTFADPNESGFTQPTAPTAGRMHDLACGTIGAFHGFVCGLLGISGGVLAVPLLQAFVRVPARNAVANSIAVSAFCTAFGGVGASVLGVQRGDFQLADLALASLCIGGGALIGAQLGARLTGRVHVLWLKLMFVLISFLAGVVILLK